MAKEYRAVALLSNEFQGNSPGAVKAAARMAKAMTEATRVSAPEMARDLKKGNPELTDEKIQEIVNSYKWVVCKVRL